MASRSEGMAGCTAYDSTEAEADSGNAGHPEHASTCTVPKEKQFLSLVAQFSIRHNLQLAGANVKVLLGRRPVLEYWGRSAYWGYRYPGSISRQQ